MRDIRLALRSLRATPVVTMVAVLSLALGIGANATIFSLLNGLLLRPLPVTDPDRLFTISSDTAIRLGFSAGIGWNNAMWTRLRDRAGAFDGAFAWSMRHFDLSDGGETRLVGGLLASGDFFATLGVSPSAGRLFTRADDLPGGGADGPVAVISHAFWQQRFGGAASAIGARLLIEGAPFTIIGVMPRAFVGMEVGRAADVVVPLAAATRIRSASDLLNPRSLLLIVALRVKQGQSVTEATSGLRAIQPQILASDPLPLMIKEPFSLASLARGTSSAEPGAPGLRQHYVRPLMTMAGGVALVLLIACANIANVQLARAAARRSEWAVRVALGASRWRLSRPLLVESLLLASVGATAGLVLASWGARGLVTRLSTSRSPIAMSVSMDWRVLVVAATLTLLAAVLFGTAPAWRASRVAPAEALKDSARGTARSDRGTVSASVVVAQVACSLVLVMAAVLFGRTLAHLARLPLGFDADRVLVVDMDTSRVTIDAPGRLALDRRLVSAGASVGGVEGSAGSTATPVSVGLILGVDPPGTASSPDHMVVGNLVTPRWFATYGTPLRAGRDFGAGDSETTAPVAIVNEALARKFFPDGHVLGASVAGRMVVGVVGNQLVQGGYKMDGTTRSLRDDAAPFLYVPLAQAAAIDLPNVTTFKISVRAGQANDGALASRVSNALRAVDPSVAFTFHPLADDVGAGLSEERLLANLSRGFGLLGLILAGLGLYGLLAEAIARQRPEIGIRLALGAGPGDVARLVLRRAARLIGIGAAIGAGASLWLSRFVTTLVYGVDARDPGVLVVAILVVAGVGLAVAGVPAIRAARVDPAEVLRTS